MRSRGNPPRKFGLSLLAGSGALVLGDYGRNYIAFKRYLDAGGVYDYREDRCRDLGAPVLPGRH